MLEIAREWTASERAPAATPAGRVSAAMAGRQVAGPRALAHASTPALASHGLGAPREEPVRN
jgi:hypothetical protein